MDPHATCYGGHQFGNWAGQLGDGRAINLGEVERRTARCRCCSSRAPGPRRTRAPPTAWRFCAPRCASSCAARRCTTSACRPPARCSLIADRRRGRARHVLRRQRPRPSPAPWSAGSRRRSCASAASRSWRHAARRPAAPLADFTIRTLFRATVGERRPSDLRRVVRRGLPRTAEMVVHWHAGRLRARRDEHRQHVDPRADHRLRALRLARRLRPDWTPNTTDASHRRYRFGSSRRSRSGTCAARPSASCR